MNPGGHPGWGAASSCHPILGPPAPGTPAPLVPQLPEKHAGPRQCCMAGGGLLGVVQSGGEGPALSPNQSSWSQLRAYNLCWALMGGGGFAGGDNGVEPWPGAGGPRAQHPSPSSPPPGPWVAPLKMEAALGDLELLAAPPGCHQLGPSQEDPPVS